MHTYVDFCRFLFCRFLQKVCTSLQKSTDLCRGVHTYVDFCRKCRGVHTYVDFCRNLQKVCTSLQKSIDFLLQKSTESVYLSAEIYRFLKQDIICREAERCTLSADFFSVDFFSVDFCRNGHALCRNL